MSMTRSATRALTTTDSASIVDRGCGGLTIAHLRAFVEQCDVIGFPPDQAVRVSVDLQVSSPHYDVAIAATRATTKGHDVPSPTPPIL